MPMLKFWTALVFSQINVSLPKNSFMTPLAVLGGELVHGRRSVLGSWFMSGIGQRKRTLLQVRNPCLFLGQRKDGIGRRSKGNKWHVWWVMMMGSFLPHPLNVFIKSRLALHASLGMCGSARRGWPTTWVGKDKHVLAKVPFLIYFFHAFL